MCSPSRAGLHKRGILQAKRQVKESYDRNGLSGVYGGWTKAEQCKTEQCLLPFTFERCHAESRMLSATSMVWQCAAGFPEHSPVQGKSLSL